ncbi:hypothetical protein P7C70_g1470, partial [Phenoliferia sp. Uapishka_3]
MPPTPFPHESSNSSPHFSSPFAPVPSTFSTKAWPPQGSLHQNDLREAESLRNHSSNPNLREALKRDREDGSAPSQRRLSYSIPSFPAENSRRRPSSGPAATYHHGANTIADDMDVDRESCRPLQPLPSGPTRKSDSKWQSDPSLAASSVHIPRNTHHSQDYDLPPIKSTDFRPHSAPSASYSRRLPPENWYPPEANSTGEGHILVDGRQAVRGAEDERQLGLLGRQV